MYIKIILKSFIFKNIQNIMIQGIVVHVSDVAHGSLVLFTYAVVSLQPNEVCFEIAMPVATINTEITLTSKV